MCYYNPLHRSRRFINQYFRFTEQKSPRIQLNNNTNRNCLLGASSCASRKKVPRCVSDVRIEVSCRRDLNTDVSVLVHLIDKSSDSDSHHAGVSLLQKDCAKTAEMWGGRCAKSTNCDCHRSGQHYLKSGGPTGQWKIKCTGPNWSGGLKSAPGQRASAYVEGCDISHPWVSKTDIPVKSSEAKQ